MSTYAFEHEGERVEVDVRGQVLHAEIDDDAAFGEFPPEDEDGDAHDEPYGDEPAIRAFDGSERWSSPLHASARATGLSSDFTPMFVLAASAKAFDDRLVAAVDRLAHESIGARMGLYTLIQDLRDEVAEDSSARTLLDAVVHLGTSEPGEVSPRPIEVRRWLARFKKNAKASKPIGFYAECPDLARIFRHDRALALAIEADIAARLREVFRRRPDLTQAYNAHLGLIQGLTGPLKGACVLDSHADEVAIVPASDSAEVRLIEQLFSDRSIPDGFDLGRELVSRIKDGRLSSSPKAEDGWYARQFHANAALLDARTLGLEIGPRYALELEDTFRGLFTLHRETHVKQLATGVGGGLPLIVAPRLSVEPVPEFYERTAAGYRWLRERLTQELGTVLMREEIRPPLDQPLECSLLDMELRFRGAAVVAHEELGQVRNDGPEDLYARSSFRRWQRNSPADPDLSTDLRVAVPLYQDLERDRLRISATVGLETRTLRFRFVRRPRVTTFGVSNSPFGPAEAQFASSTRSIVAPVTLECDVRTPPTRAQLRAICDQHRDPSAIKAALEATDFGGCP